MTAELDLKRAHRQIAEAKAPQSTSSTLRATNGPIYEVARKDFRQRLSNYHGIFGFLQDMKKKANTPGFQPTWTQIAAVDKCLRAEAPKPQPKPSPKRYKDYE